MEKRGFFSTLISCCRGTEDFPELIERSFPTVLGHALLLILLISIAVGFAPAWRLSGELVETRRDFIVAFGSELQMTDMGILPQRDPEMARSINLPHDGILLYTGLSGKRQSFPTDLAGLRYIVYWAGNLPAIAFRGADHSWMVSSFGQEAQLKLSASADEALAELTREPEQRRWQWGKRQTIPVESIFTMIIWSVGLTFGVRQFILMTVLMFLSVGVLVLLMRFSPRKFLTAGQLWKCGIYAGFPAMLIGGCFPLLDLPLLDYSDVYIFGLFIYWAVVLRSLARAAADDGQGGSL